MMNNILLFFAAGIGFWLAIAAINILILVLSIFERPYWATFTFIATLFFLYTAGVFNIVVYLRTNPLDALLFAAGYAILAFGFAIMKWYFKTEDCRVLYRELRERFLERNRVKGGEVPVSLRAQWADEVRRHPEVSLPKRIDHKDRIITWMAYWPWCLLWTICGDFMRRLGERLYQLTGKAFDKITSRAQREYEADLVPTKVAVEDRND